jgi:hypothetical protein
VVLVFPVLPLLWPRFAMQGRDSVLVKIDYWRESPAPS